MSNKHWFVFDLDKTLIDETFLPFNDTRHVLEKLKSLGYTISLASFNLNADSILSAHDLEKYFTGIRFNQTQTKTDMIKDLALLHNKNHHDTIFFDDNPINVAHTSKYYIHSIKVDENIGVTLQMIEDVLQKIEKPVLYCNIDYNVNLKENAILNLLHTMFNSYRLKIVHHGEPKHHMYPEFLEGDFFLSIVTDKDYYSPYFDVRFVHRPTNTICKARSSSLCGLKDLYNIPIETNYRVATMNILYSVCNMVAGQMERVLNEIDENKKIFSVV